MKNDHPLKSPIRIHVLSRHEATTSTTSTIIIFSHDLVVISSIDFFRAGRKGTSSPALHVFFPGKAAVFLPESFFSRKSPDSLRGKKTENLSGTHYFIHKTPWILSREKNNYINSSSIPFKFLGFFKHLPFSSNNLWVFSKIGVGPPNHPF